MWNYVISQKYSGITLSWQLRDKAKLLVVTQMVRGMFIEGNDFERHEFKSGGWDTKRREATEWEVYVPFIKWYIISLGHNLNFLVSFSAEEWL